MRVVRVELTDTERELLQNLIKKGSDWRERKRDPERFEQAQRDIAELIVQAKAGEIELAYVDEAGFTQPPESVGLDEKGQTPCHHGETGTATECDRGSAVVGPVSPGEMVAEHQWAVVFCVFDGHAGITLVDTAL